MTENLKELRKRLGLTQEEAALGCGVSKRSIGYWEAGRKAPSMYPVALYGIAFRRAMKDWRQYD